MKLKTFKIRHLEIKTHKKSFLRNKNGLFLVYRDIPKEQKTGTLKT